MQLNLIKMHVVAAAVTALTVETKACYAVACQFMMNAMIIGW